MTPEARGTAVAIFSSALYFGQTAGVAAGALVIDRLGAVPLFLGTAVCAVVRTRIATAPASGLRLASPPIPFRFWFRRSDLDQRHLRHGAAARRRAAARTITARRLSPRRRPA